MLNHNDISSTADRPLPEAVALAPRRSQCNRDDEYSRSAGILEHPGALRHRAAGSDNVIHEEDTFSRDAGGTGNGEGPTDVGPALPGGKGHLGNGGTDTAEGVPQKRQAPLAGQDGTHENRLVEPPLPQTRTVEGDGNDYIGDDGLDKGGEMPNGEEGQGAAQVGLVAVLVAVDQLLEGTVEEERPPDPVEGGRGEHAGTAEVVDPPLGPVRYAADRAEGGGDGGHGPEAGIAEMERACPGHRRLAQVAEGREKDVEKRPEELH